MIIRTLVTEHLIEIEYGGVRLLVRKAEIFVFYATFVTNEYYRLKTRPGDTVLDFGANIGDFTVKAALMLNGKGRIIAIEPSHENVDILKANLELNNIKNAEVYETAISDSDGYVNLEGGGTVSSHLKPESTGREERVKAYSITTFIEEAGLSSRDDLVVKMDIEGSERHVIKDIS